MWSEFDLAMHYAGKPENEKVRQASRKDRNHAEIKQAFRSMGASVADLSNVGGGCPDIMVGFRGQNFLIEIKTEDGRISKTQSEWHAAWAGQVAVVRSIDEAKALVSQIGGKS